MTPTATATDWDAFWSGVGNEDWLAAKRLLDLSPRVSGFFAAHLRVQEVEVLDDEGQSAGTHHETTLHWSAAAESLDGEGLSSTEARLARLVVSIACGTPFAISDLRWMGSWSHRVWRILTEWGTDAELAAMERAR